MRYGYKVLVDEYMFYMPIGISNRKTPKTWQNIPYFHQFDKLEGIPIITLNIYFYRKIGAINNMCFSFSPLLSIYTSIYIICKEC